jgi:hypothetical protein
VAWVCGRVCARAQVSEAGSGWVAKLRLADFPLPTTHARDGEYAFAHAHPDEDDGSSFSSYWGAAEVLSAAEQRVLGLALVSARHASPLYAR